MQLSKNDSCDLIIDDAIIVNFQGRSDTSIILYWHFWKDLNAMILSFQNKQVQIYSWDVEWSC